MKQEQDKEGKEGMEATEEECRTEMGYNDDVIAERHNSEHEDDHHGAQRPQGGAEFEDVPRHLITPIRSLQTIPRTR